MRPYLARAWPLLALVTACASAETTVDGPGGSSGAPGEGPGAEPTEQRYFLRVDDEPVPLLKLDLNREKALKLFGEEAARQIVLLRMDTTALLQNVVDAIRNACGGAWRADDSAARADLSGSPYPTYDCSSTELGRTFGDDWRATPEFALVRLLGMTPANANVEGTSLQDFFHVMLQNREYWPRLDPANVLGIALGVPRTEPLIGTEALVAALRTQLLGTHPSVGNMGGRLPISLYDALRDLKTLPEKLGQRGTEPWTGPGEHPGVLVPDDGGFTTTSDVLLPSFHMRVVARSNLHMVQGIALGKGAGEMFFSVGDDPLTFHFDDPAWLEVHGIADNPTIDMRLVMHEWPGIVPACTGLTACANNLPPPLGTPWSGGVWTVPPPLLESIVARAAFNAYSQRRFTDCYVTKDGFCLEGLDIGQNGAPPGWMVLRDDWKHVKVPEPQYLWELIDEIAQVALHDPDADREMDIPEGAAPVFALRGVPIGVSGPELVDQMRPNLQSQADTIASVILGRYWKANDPIDFYYRRPAPDAPPYLFFIAEDDLRPSPEYPDQILPYTYDHPGFYASPLLTPQTKVSSRLVPGVEDTAHEKYRLSAGSTTLYAQDRHGRVYAVDFFVPGDEREISARVSPL